MRDEISQAIVEKLEKLEAALRGMGSLVVAFSGGVDSTFLSVMAGRVLGERALAVTATSAAYARRELAEAKKLAQEHGFRHAVIESDEVSIPGFAQNSPDRCYHCKSGLFTELLKIAEREGIANVADGTNCDDEGDYRPGRRAAAEKGIRCPLAECGFTKDDIRQASRILGLETADKPAFACLASRFPYGDRITLEKLGQIEAVEDLLCEKGLGVYRARHHGRILRLELGAEEMEAMADPELRSQVVKRAREVGFEYVTMDLEPYRTGRLNEVLDRDES